MNNKWIITDFKNQLKAIVFSNSFDNALKQARKINANFNSGHIANDNEEFNEPNFKEV